LSEIDTFAYKHKHLQIAIKFSLLIPSVLKSITFSSAGRLLPEALAGVQAKRDEKVNEALTFRRKSS